MFRPDNKKFVMSLLVLAMLAYMLWDTVWAYFEGGKDAPTVLILVIALFVLGGGAVFAAKMAYSAWRDMSKTETPGTEDNQKTD